jgi:hypothetical protein
LETRFPISIADAKKCNSGNLGLLPVLRIKTSEKVLILERFNVAPTRLHHIFLPRNGPNNPMTLSVVTYGPKKMKNAFYQKNAKTYSVQKGGLKG